MPENEVNGEPQCAAIRLNPDGSELIVTERRSGSIVFFSVEKSGKLSRAGIVKTEACPRDAVFSPDGKWLLTACQQADSVCVYSYAKAASATISTRVKLQSTITFPKNSAPCSLLFA